MTFDGEQARGSRGALHTKQWSGRQGLTPASQSCALVSD